MHELSLLRGVVDTVLDAAGNRPVTTIALVVGQRSGVLIDALHNAWPLAIAHTPLANTQLTITDQPATVYCPSCATEVIIDEFFALRCPVCDTPTGDLRKGSEFLIEWIDVGEPSPDQ